jgi:hypothetical protein
MRTSRSVSRATLTALDTALPAALALTLFGCGGGNDSGTGTPTTPAANEFAVEGSIANLKGSGAVLQNNGAQDVTLNSGQAGFKFRTQLAGTTYNVALKSQPLDPTQTCTVTGGSGTVTGPVTTISIACVSALFPVGGSVSGLTGTGLTLTNNGGAPLAVASGATSFTFAGVESGTSYSIKIATQPSGQTCIVNNADGGVFDAAITTVQVVCVTGGSPLITLSGDVSGLGNSGLQLSLNGGAPVSVAGGASAFAFPPTALKAGDAYDMVIVRMPTNMSCNVARGRGVIVGTNNVTNLGVNCKLAGPQSQSGAFEAQVNGKRQVLVLHSNNNFALVNHADNPGCANNGNGLEFGHYRWNLDNSWFVSLINYDNTGSCGIWDPTVPPGSGLQATIVNSGATFTLSTGATPIAFSLLPSTPGTVVGTWLRNDGFDGVVLIFEPNGTYIYVDPQDTNTGGPAGVERGCYAVAGGSITFSAGATCTPDGSPAIDQNGTSGFSTKYGVAQPFTLVSEVLTIGSGKHLVRIAP